MNWIQPLSEDFLYCSPQEIRSELYRICSDEQALPAEKKQTELSGEQEGQSHD